MGCGQAVASERATRSNRDVVASERIDKGAGLARESAGVLPPDLIRYLRRTTVEPIGSNVVAVERYVYRSPRDYSFELLSVRSGT